MWLKTGQSVTVERVFSQDDFDRFAALSGDDNPIHVDAEFAATTRFGKTVSHGMLLYALIDGLLAGVLPGAVALEQELIFPAPTYTGEELTARLEALEVRDGGRLARLGATVTKRDGTVVCQGTSLVVLPLSEAGAVQ